MKIYGYTIMWRGQAEVTYNPKSFWASSYDKRDPKAKTRVVEIALVRSEHARTKKIFFKWYGGTRKKKWVDSRAAIAITVLDNPWVPRYVQDLMLKVMYYNRDHTLHPIYAQTTTNIYF